METPNLRENVDTLLQEPLQRFLAKDPEFRVNKLENMLQKTEVAYDDSTWVSSVRRGNEEGVNRVTVGLKPLPDHLVEQWSIGSRDQNEQILFKLAHELSHAFQTEKGYESALVSFLNGNDDLPEYTLPYIELYALLSGTGPVNGLTTAAIYAEQSRRTGNLRMETFEDMTELIAAYLVSDQYFLYRLENSITPLSAEQREEIAKKIIEICKDLH